MTVPTCSRSSCDRVQQKLAIGEIWRRPKLTWASLNSSTNVNSSGGNRNMQTDLAPSAPRSSTRGRTAVMAFFSALVLGLAAPIILLVWQAASPTATIRRGAAGTFVSATSSQGGFTAPALTTVETTLGSFTVASTFSAPRGRALTLERTNKSGLKLCVAGVPGTCTDFLGAWPDSIPATPEAGDVFDFQSSIFNHETLLSWLFLGIVATFITMIIAAFAATPREQKEDDASNRAEGDRHD